MTLLGSSIKEAREASPSMTIRKLAELAGISHTQVSRIESGEVAMPSREVLDKIAGALERNPRPLFILAGHYVGEEAQDALAPMFRDGAELPEVWGDWSAFTLDKARQLVRQPDPDPKAIQQLAADVFSVAETDETLRRPEDAMLAVMGEGQREMLQLLNAWRFIGAGRRRQLLDYASALRRLEDLEYLAEAEGLQLESAAIPGDAQAGSQFSEEHLASAGFEGFVRIVGLPPRAQNVPPTPGVYAVVRRSTEPVTFLDESVGGRFKGRDPTVSTVHLERAWVDAAATLYLGRASSLRDRLNLLARFGRGDAVGHWGGRYLWQLADHDQLIVAWYETVDQVAREAELVDEFHDAFDALPFANLARPRREGAK